MPALFTLFVLHICFYAMGDIEIGSLNLNGARDDGKRASLFKLDVILGQETNCTPDNLTDWRTQWTS